MSREKLEATAVRIVSSFRRMKIITVVNELKRLKQDEPELFAAVLANMGIK